MGGSELKCLKKVENRTGLSVSQLFGPGARYESSEGARDWSG